MWNSNISQKGLLTNDSKVEFLTPPPFLIPLFICEDVPLCVVHYQGRCRSLVVIRESYDSWVFSSVYIHQDTSILSQGGKAHSMYWLNLSYTWNHYSSFSCTNYLLFEVLTGFAFYKYKLALDMHTAGLQIITRSLQHSLQKYVQASFKSQRHGVLQYEDLPNLLSSVKCHCLVGCKRMAWKTFHSPLLSHKVCQTNFQAKMECTENTNIMPVLKLCCDTRYRLVKHR